MALLQFYVPFRGCGILCMKPGWVHAEQFYKEIDNDFYQCYCKVVKLMMDFFGTDKGLQASQSHFYPNLLTSGSPAAAGWSCFNSFER